MKNSSLKVVCSLAVLSLVASCGDSGNKSTKGASRRQEEVAPVDGSNIDGHYQAKFTTLNGHVNGTIPGSANFLRMEDRLFAYVRLFAGGVKAWHMQHVYTGSRCPTMNDDTNLDGFIDIAEAEAVVGKILIPMDSDISTQGSGRRFFPLGDLSGYYHYERITSFRRFLNDLQDTDKDPNDDTAKLAPGEGLRLEGRVFMAMGVAETIMLPETVATKERRRPFQTLPIVCGVFSKFTGQPGRPYVDGEVVGPVASVEPDQDKPADDTIPETTGGTSGGSTGSNDSDDGEGPVSDGDGNTHTTGGTTAGGSTTGGTTTSGGTTGSGSTTGSHTGSTSGGSTTGGPTTGGTTGGSTTGGSTSGGSTTGGSSSSSSSSTTTTTTTTGGSSSSSSSSTSTGSTAGGFLDSSSGV
jgi:hypothetical protein